MQAATDEDMRRAYHALCAKRRCLYTGTMIHCYHETCIRHEFAVDSLTPSPCCMNCVHARPVIRSGVR